MKTATILKRSIRKVKNQNLFKVNLSVITASGIKRTIIFYERSRGLASNKSNFHLRNYTQSADFVNIS